MKTRTVLAIGAGVVGGFLSPLPDPSLPRQPGEPPTVRIPKELPWPTERFLRAAYGDWIPITDTVSMWGNVIMRLGPIWARATMRNHHVLGKAFAARFALRWFGIPVFEGMEGFANGRGYSKIGGNLIEGRAADRANTLLMWSEAHFFPFASLLNPAAEWHEAGESAVSLQVPVNDGAVEAIITYDPATGYPSSYEAIRDRSETDSAPGRVSYADWTMSNGLVIPGSGSVQWMDEDSPWLRLRISGAGANLNDPFGPLEP